MKRIIQGFTIIELLLVLVILAILVAIVSSGLVRQFRTAELNNAAYQVAADYRRARSQAQQQSINTIITWSSRSDYTVSQGSSVKSLSVPNNVSVSCSAKVCSPLTYSAPYGEVAGLPAGTVLTLSSPATSLNIIPMEIRVVGVTGKVVVTRQGS